MDRIFLTITLLMFFSASTLYGQDNGSSLLFDEKTYDFGPIAESDGKVSHIFEFTNTGTIPAVIESVSVSCGCTSHSYSHVPVKPGKKGNIEITYDPTDRPGDFLKKIVIKSNRSTYILEVKGTVIPRPPSIENSYPVKLQNGVRLTTASINFDRVGQGQTKSMTIGYINTSDKDVKLKVVSAEINSWLKVIAPDKVRAGGSGNIIFSVDLTHISIWGHLTIPIDVFINGIKQEQGVVVSALAVDNFDELAIGQGACSKLDTQFFHFGSVNVDDGPLSHEFTLENTGNIPLIIRAIQYDRGVTSTLHEGTSVESGDSVRFTVTIESANLSTDRIIRSVKLIMNDPVRPIREIRMVVNVRFH